MNLKAVSIILETVFHNSRYTGTMSPCISVCRVAKFGIVFGTIWDQKKNRYWFSLGFKRPILYVYIHICFHLITIILRYMSVELRMERHIPAKIEGMEVLKTTKIHFAFGLERI